MQNSKVIRSIVYTNSQYNDLCRKEVKKLQLAQQEIELQAIKSKKNLEERIHNFFSDDQKQLLIIIGDLALDSLDRLKLTKNVVDTRLKKFEEENKNN